MRTALISTLYRTHDGTPLAFLQMGGRSVLHWQADLALALGCERIVCLASATLPEIEDVRGYIERNGAQFHLIDRMLQFVRLVSADQEVVVIADGVVLDRSQLPDHLTKGRGVLSIPAEPGLAAGFERIDADYAWAGLLVSRGSIVERVADMPPDSDVIALLLRLALQARTPLVSLRSDVLDDGSLLLALDESVVASRETALLSNSTLRVPWWGPGNAIAARLAKPLAPQALQMGPLISGLLGAGLVGAGVVTSLFGFAVIGLSLFAAGCLGLNVSGALRHLKERLYALPSKPRMRQYIGNLTDTLLIVCLAAPLALETAHEKLFLPVIMMGLLRLAANMAGVRYVPLVNDRVLLAAILAVGAWFGVLTEAMGGVSLVGLIAALIFQSKLR